MNTTAKGKEFEDRVYRYLSSLLEINELPNVNKKYSKIFQHKEYKTDTSRKIDCDITIENYNPLSEEETWSSLVVVECKNYGEKVNIGDFDEFQTKLRNISGFSIKGIMVTTVGFSSSTIEKARKEHIALIVVSDENFDWIVNRDIYSEPEHLMPRLKGEEKTSNNPIVYYGSKFYNIINLLEEFEVIISGKHYIQIPFIKEEEIKKLAFSIYNEFQLETDEISGEILFKKFPKYKINFEDFPKGVLGVLSLKHNIISLSNKIMNDSKRRNFTIAHEIGHIVLHSSFFDTIEQTYEYDDDNVSPIVNEEVYRRMESQANLFASYLLIPEKNLFVYFNKILEELNIHKKQLYLDSQPCNIKDVNYALLKLSEHFNVSKEVIKYRLKNENLLIIDNNEPQRIRNIFRGYR